MVAVTVYVDDFYAPYGRMKMCHMFADSHAELLEMAQTIGVGLHYIQARGTHREHFDICKAKRALAVKYGAKEIDMREVGRMMTERRKARQKGTP